MATDNKPAPAGTAGLPADAGESGRSSALPELPPAPPGTAAPRARRGRWERLLVIARLRTLRPISRRWLGLRPAQQLVVGFGLYMLIGWLLLCLPWAQAQPVSWVDNLFTAVSAVSTTGLVTVATGDTYSLFGEFVVVLLFQVGGVGYMTVSSFVLLSRGRPLGRTREGILGTGFVLPRYFDVPRFVRQVVVFTLAIELAGVALLWPMFALAGEERPLWSAIFHTVSAFCTAGFSIHADSLERYANHTGVNLVIGALCLLGSGGFIVMQDVWYSLRYRERMVTFTSKVILTVMTVGIGVSMLLLLLLEPTFRAMSASDAVVAAFFQSMTAMTTAGFNTVPIGGLASASTMVIVVLMVIGASPSGTGGGLKTTTLSALLATMTSVLRARDRITLLGNEIPAARVLAATAAATLYLMVLAIGIIALTAVEHHPVQLLVFEVVSALGTVGLSMGVTGDLSVWGKLTLIAVMFIGRLGPLTLGLALLRPQPKVENVTVDDLAV